MVVQLYLQAGKRDEALQAAKDFLKLEPDNPLLQDITNQLEQNQKGATLQEIFNDVNTAMKAGQNDRAGALLDQLLHSKQANGPILTQVAQLYAQMRDLPKAEEAMRRATEVDPGSSQSWYNLANVQAFAGRAADAAQSLRRAFATNAVERAADPRMIDLRTNVLTNPNFNAIRQSPEFRAVMGTN
jgi:predicted Zn-dependent protease